ncbi:50S ribosomal protein L11 methyltransferase [Maribacter aestuarii]|uniref:50S ribosomal protein L11 methyltransferase n=1 Tax=Maribacter aestuarii TaxID=1130723 RepID=UPI0025A56468|nr:50S ribosomal protein L11 methyltransferase [Maribacter aestuarii]
MSTKVYIEYRFEVSPMEPGGDILIAQLGEIGFESFVQEDEHILAYIQKEDWSIDSIEDVQLLNNPIFEIAYRFKEIEQENWNAAWEKNFQPIIVDNTCKIRAPFHEKGDEKYDIVIEPKMSFGTGHHETTHMMLQHILELDLKDKSVLDMGCGTGVLAILSAMRGAILVDAIDIDNWSYLNAKENIARNGFEFIAVYEGDATLLGKEKYDLIIANINRNILLNDIPTYVNCLNENGILLLSGFYNEDLPIITGACHKEGMEIEKKLEKNNWVAAKYVF